MLFGLKLSLLKNYKKVMDYVTFWQKMMKQWVDGFVAFSDGQRCQNVMQFATQNNFKNYKKQWIAITFLFFIF